MAGRAFYWITSMALPRCSFGHPGTQEGTARTLVGPAIPVHDSRYRILLCTWLVLGNAFASHGGRVLALVGRAPLGRRILRSVRHCCDCIPVREAPSDTRRPRGVRCAAIGRDLFERWNYRNA